MIALTINETRPFMAALLTKETFDRFLLREASLTTFCTYTVDGTWQSAYFDSKDRAPGDDAAADSPASSGSESGKPRLTPWSYLRPRFFDLIKGQHTPLALRAVFQYPSELTQELLGEAGLSSLAGSVYGLYLNLKYDGSQIFITTGSAQQSFPPSLDIDRVWDNSVKSLLAENGLAFEDIS